MRANRMLRSIWRGWKRDHGSRTEAQRESRWIRHRQLRVSGHEKPIRNNRFSKSPIEPVEMGRGTVRTKPGQMVRKRFPNHPGR